ncbi:MAG: choice-of-anchor B family protein [Thermoanaerobaculia bacterium]
MRTIPGFAAFALTMLAFAGSPSAAWAAEDPDAEHLRHVEESLGARATSATPLVPEHLQPCVGGMSNGVYPCSNVDLVEFMPASTFGVTVPGPQGVLLNSLWGWTDPVTAHEWVLLGLNNGTAFIDITDPEEPFYAGKLPTHSGTSNVWRDVRVYQSYAYIVSEQTGHGMQIFNLAQLRSIPTTAPPATFTETGWYNKVSNTHTISINEDTGYAYLVGTTGGSTPVVTCGGNMQIVNLATPATPQFVACYNDDATSPGYVHENQCFVYHGPDLDCDPVTAGNQACAGREICLASRGSAHNLDIIDVTDHALPVRLASLHYNTSGYSHQAWFTEDQRYILLDDELDEENVGNPTRTYIFDALNLNAPVLSGGNGYFDHTTDAIDHNLYVRGNFVFQSNYESGLRILQLTDLAQSTLTEVGFFDLFPSSDAAEFDGTWNNYPFFASGNIPVSHISQGLYILRPTNLCSNPASPSGLSAAGNGDHRIDLSWTPGGAPGATFAVDRALGGCSGTFEEVATGLAAPSYSDLSASGAVTYGYRVRESSSSGLCVSEPSGCSEASTTGSCTAAPQFAGLASATNGAQAGCQISLSWSAASAFCGGPATYSVYRGATDSFVPAVSNRIAQGLSSGTYLDSSAASGTSYYYVVRATDATSGGEEENLVRRSAKATGPLADGTFATSAELGDPILDTLTGPVETTLSTGDVPVSPEHAGWHLSTARFHAGARSFFSTSSNSLCVSLEQSALSLTAGQSSTLTFWTAWDIEATYDGGIVQISTDGGTNWTLLTPSGGYPNTVTQTGNACVALQAPFPKPAFSSTTQLVNFVQKSIDLSAYAGQTVKLAWRYGSDTGTNGEGWYVDDIALTHAQVPGSCIQNLLFRDGFETGNLSTWSSTVP